jgi:hypothetical protein
MKKIIVLAVAAMLPRLSPAEAQTICQRIGNSTYCDNGLSSQTIGSTTFYDNGVTRQDIGNTSFYNAYGAGRLPGAPAPYAPNRSGCAGAPSCR